MFTKPLFAALLIVVGLETVATTGLPKRGVRQTVPVPSRTLRIARRNRATCERQLQWTNGEILGDAKNAAKDRGSLKSS
ncbi:hypothetical protein [Paraburkholderia metrosideri]|uniref:hypothetical protein n=1 Tax=Paraburkholderia metrosideri TaxID=580937 RepID=UPI00191A3455|nr:hypothetical protein [Paraburkholderia metrosideri]